MALRESAKTRALGLRVGMPNHTEKEENPDLGLGMEALVPVGKLGGQLVDWEWSVRRALGRWKVSDGENTFNFLRAQGVIYAAPGEQRFWFPAGGKASASGSRDGRLGSRAANESSSRNHRDRRKTSLPEGKAHIGKSSTRKSRSPQHQ
ncbi:hypothetical protein JTB14_001338 [Gonioctena quinquepunctata]|nr:hypothetical protein JTB14_001338 [Gonioctena quinquepunctata]